MARLGLDGNLDGGLIGESRSVCAERQMALGGKGIVLVQLFFCEIPVCKKGMRVPSVEEEFSGAVGFGEFRFLLFGRLRLARRAKVEFLRGSAFGRLRRLVSFEKDGRDFELGGGGSAGLRVCGIGRFGGEPRLASVLNGFSRWQ